MEFRTQQDIEDAYDAETDGQPNRDPWYAQHDKDCEYARSCRITETREDYIKREMFLFGRRFTTDSELDDYFGKAE